MGFREEDVKALQDFSKFIGDKAKMTMTVSESITFVKLMQAYQSVTNKVAANIIELKNITEPEAPAKKPKQGK